jgi:hypothetical protein
LRLVVGSHGVAREVVDEFVDRPIDVRNLGGLCRDFLGDFGRFGCDIFGADDGLVDHAGDLLGACGLFVGRVCNFGDPVGDLLDRLVDIFEVFDGPVD